MMDPMQDALDNHLGEIDNENVMDHGVCGACGRGDVEVQWIETSNDWLCTDKQECDMSIVAAEHGFDVRKWTHTSTKKTCYVITLNTPGYMTSFCTTWFKTQNQAFENTKILLDFFGEDLDEKVARMIFIDIDETNEKEIDDAQHLEHV